MLGVRIRGHFLFEVLDQLPSVPQTFFSPLVTTSLRGVDLHNTSEVVRARLEAVDALLACYGWRSYTTARPNTRVDVLVLHLA